jgi:hypothetical protein
LRLHAVNQNKNFPLRINFAKGPVVVIEVDGKVDMLPLQKSFLGRHIMCLCLQLEQNNQIMVVEKLKGLGAHQGF